MYEYSNVESAIALYENFGTITICDGDAQQVFREKE